MQAIHGSISDVSHAKEKVDAFDEEQQSSVGLARSMVGGVETALFDDFPTTLCNKALLL